MRHQAQGLIVHTGFSVGVTEPLRPDELLDPNDLKVYFYLAVDLTNRTAFLLARDLAAWNFPIAAVALGLGWTRTEGVLRTFASDEQHWQHVLLHHRDARAAVYPDRWSFICGKSEIEDGGDPSAPWRRELHEELGIAVEPNQSFVLWSAIDSRVATLRWVFYCEWPHLTDRFILVEGSGVGWFTLYDALRLPTLSLVAKDDLQRFMRRVNHAS